MIAPGYARAAAGNSSANKARQRRTRRHWTGVSLLVVAWLGLGSPPPAVRAGDQAAGAAKMDNAPVITLELPHPELVIDRITSPRIQRSLELVPAYRRFREGPQFRELQGIVAVVAGRLGMSWDRALRELTGGGIAARVFAEPGREPRLAVIVTARDPKLLDRLSAIFLDLARQDARTKKTPDPVAAPTTGAPPSTPWERMGGSTMRSSRGGWRSPVPPGTSSGSSMGCGRSPRTRPHRPRPTWYSGDISTSTGCGRRIPRNTC